MPESKQALLFDRERSTHVLAEVGGEVDGYTVDAIIDDEVMLSRNGTQVVLVAPESGPPAAAHAEPAAKSRAVPVADAKPAGDPLPLDPYAEGGTRAASAADGGDSAVHVASATGAVPLPPDPEARAVSAAAPSTGTEAAPAPAPAPAASLAINTDSAPATQAAGSALSEHRTTAAGTTAPPTAAPPSPAPPSPAPPSPAPPSPAPPSPAPPSPAPPSPAPAVAAAAPAVLGPTAPTTAPATGDAVVTRAEVNATLANFAKLTADVQGNFSPSGVVIERVAPGTIFQRIGLRAGDVITAVDGVRVRSIDDAASVYAKVSTAKQVSAQIVRKGASMTLHVAIQ
jgi:type II secretory pathway component PulC